MENFNLQEYASTSDEIGGRLFANGRVSRYGMGRGKALEELALELANFDSNISHEKKSKVHTKEKDEKKCIEKCEPTNIKSEQHNPPARSMENVQQMPCTPGRLNYGVCNSLKKTKPQRSRYRELTEPHEQLDRVDAMIKRLERDLEITKNCSNPVEQQILKNNTKSVDTASCNLISKVRLIAENKPTSIEILEQEMPFLNEIKSVLLDTDRVFRTHNILAHSQKPVRKIEYLIDAKLIIDKHVWHGLFEMGIGKLLNSQQYAWPHLTTGKSLFFVNTAKSGKTSSYLPCVCSRTYERYIKEPNTYGPIAIIIVPSAAHAENVYNQCSKIFNMCKISNKFKLIVPLYGEYYCHSARIDLTVGCGILLITPVQFNDIMEKNKTEKLIDIERLDCIVIDDIDIMFCTERNGIMSPNGIVFATMMEFILTLCKSNEQNYLEKQLIVTSSEWYDALQLPLLRKINEPLLLFGDFIEAAVFSDTLISIKNFKNDQKINAIKDFIHEHQPIQRKRRLLIMCHSDGEVFHLLDALLAAHIIGIGYTSYANIDVSLAAHDWKNVFTDSILICTDTGLKDLELNNVDYLVHYSFPDTWSQFTQRFATMAQKFQNILKEKFKRNLNRVDIGDKPLSLIMINVGNDELMPKLTAFFKHHNNPITNKDLLKISKEAKRQSEENRIVKGIPLCKLLLEFGKCYNYYTCPYRHVLTPKDALNSSNIAVDFEYRMKIIKIYSPTHLAASVIEFKASHATNWREVRLKANIFVKQMQIHYKNYKKCKLYWPPIINEICIMRTTDNVFERVRVLDIPKMASGRLKRKNPLTLNITVQQLDMGTEIITVRSQILFVCHEKFKEQEPLALNVRLIGVAPRNNERLWSAQALYAAQKWLQIAPISSTGLFHICPSIDYVMSNTIFVNDIIIMEEHAKVGTLRISRKLKDSLILTGLAESNLPARNTLRVIIQKLHSGINATTDIGTNLCHNKQTVKTITKGKKENLIDSMTENSDDDEWHDAIDDKFPI